MCARACQNSKAFVSSTKAAKLPVKTWLVPGEPLFLLRQTTAADEAAESWEGSPATGSQVPPPTALDSPIKAVSSQPQVFYRMTSFITLLFTGNDVYLIYHFFQDFFFPLLHLASYISYSSTPPCTKTKEKWHCCCRASPTSPISLRRNQEASKPRACVR